MRTLSARRRPAPGPAPALPPPPSPPPAPADWARRRTAQRAGGAGYPDRQARRLPPAAHRGAAGVGCCRRQLAPPGTVVATCSWLRDYSTHRRWLLLCCTPRMHAEERFNVAASRARRQAPAWRSRRRRQMGAAPSACRPRSLPAPLLATRTPHPSHAPTHPNPPRNPTHAQLPRVLHRLLDSHRPQHRLHCTGVCGWGCGG